MDKPTIIWVVEDDVSINRLISYNLSKNGLDPECVFDGYQAQEKLAKEVFDRIDADMIFQFVAVATGLARSRAYTSHYRGKRIGFSQ